MFFDRLTVGMRLAFSFGLIISFYIILSLLIITNAADMQTNVENVRNHAFETTQAAQRIKTNVLQLQLLLKDALLSGSPSELTHLKPHAGTCSEKIYEDLIILQKNYTGSREQVENLKQNLKEWEPIRNGIFTYIISGDRETAALETKTRSADKADKIIQLLSPILSHAENEADSYQTRAISASNKLILQSCLLHIPALIAAALAAYFVTLSVTQPLKEITLFAEEVSRGDLDASPPITHKAEFGKAQKAIEQMVNTLKSGQNELKEKASLLDNVLQQLSKVSAHLAYKVHRLQGKHSNNDSPENDVQLWQNIRRSAGIVKSPHTASTLNKMIDNLSAVLEEAEEQNWLRKAENDLVEIISGETNPIELCEKALQFLSERLKAPVAAFFKYRGEEKRLKLIAGVSLSGGDIQHYYKSGEGIPGRVALQKEPLYLEDCPINTRSSCGELNLRCLFAAPLVFEKELLGVIELASTSPLRPCDRKFIDKALRLISVSLHTNESRLQLKNLFSQSKEQAEELEKRTLSLEKQHEAVRRKNTELDAAHRELEHKAHALEEAGKYKTEFFANMSHELRTPLNGILVLSGQLSKNTSGNFTEKQVEWIETIHNEGGNLMKLINGLLDLSKAEAGKIEARIQNVDIKKLINKLDRSFRFQIEEKQLDFVVKINENLPDRIETDPDKLHQILVNLLGNALKFTSKGRISLLVEAHSQIGPLFAPDGIAFVVEDTGIGISKEKIGELFESFNQLDSGIGRKYGGTGLGLYIAKQLTDLLGGEITVKSKRGQGCRFTVSFASSLGAETKTTPSLVADQS